ncbi:MAG TPA: carbohydrate ABC transporter permease, partial [Bacillaceae bacterium]|nr:carbohydrate ABC transporter permease [Bacillaceae bacterium]
MSNQKSANSNGTTLVKGKNRSSLLERNRDPLLKLKLGIGFVIALAFILPIIWMIFVSIKPNGFTTTDVIKWFTPPFTISNYVDILVDSLIIRWTFNSFIIALITTILTLIITSLAAFAFSQMKFRFKKTLF